MKIKIKNIVGKKTLILISIFIFGLVILPLIAMAAEDFFTNRTIAKNAENISLFQIRWDAEAKKQEEIKDFADMQIEKSKETQEALHKAAENSREILQGFCIKINFEHRDCEKIKIQQSTDGEPQAFWQLENDKSGYKNNTLKTIQTHAKKKEVEDWKIPYLLAWLYHENGSLTEDRRGDGGLSVGLCQCHTGHRDCETTFNGQLSQCIDWFSNYTKKSTEKTILTDVKRGHNPLATYKSYEAEILKKMKLFSFKKA